MFASLAPMMEGLRVESLFGAEGKNVVVTGGGQGIGLMIAAGFVANGAHVIICSRGADKCKKAADGLTALGPGTCTWFAADLAGEAGCLALAAHVRKAFPAVHVLVNNSGTAWGEPMESYPDKAWDKLFALNVKAIFTVTRALLPELDRGSAPGAPARVINIGSTAGLRPQPVPTFAYDASKAAVHHLTRKLAAELARREHVGGHSITVNAIAPGLVPSKMSMQLTNYINKDELDKSSPLGRPGAPADMAGAALFLAGGGGAWVTGTVVTVDGGATSAPAHWGQSKL